MKKKITFHDNRLCNQSHVKLPIENQYKKEHKHNKNTNLYLNLSYILHARDFVTVVFAYYIYAGYDISELELYKRLTILL